MPAYALVTLGASASAGMVLTPNAGIFPLQYQKSLIYVNWPPDKAESFSVL